LALFHHISRRPSTTILENLDDHSAKSDCQQDIATIIRSHHPHYFLVCPEFSCRFAILSKVPDAPAPDLDPDDNQGIRIRVWRLFRTAQNIFGLSRLYRSNKRPSHDPEERVDMQDLCDGPSNNPIEASPAEGPSPLHPYPNQNSFLLGDWYWNQGVQKSRGSFQSLLNIVGDPHFDPQDVRETKWASIDNELASNDFDEDPHVWEDEDAGWRRKPITITIPFHSRMKNPGTQQSVVFDLYHRSIVSVIKEKLANPRDNAKFHYEPYEYLWKPTEDSDEVRVHGEMYTSAAFHDAHRELQAAPGEPNCTLPRVVVALMFSSDATHLTSFGNAKLWPCYLYFGNESKYRRCRPSSKLCNHIAYFQKVECFPSVLLRCLTNAPNPSFLTLSRTF
jgi:hypothetical protein